ncbi:cell division protein FtsA [Candidatus Roizmanbacteria bacterium RIFCSPLOWO2_01_FULL_42_14]|uniref:Cell division protein FtsA n=4 Tax=Candidatus Roizmaniibacteriota TaxID=1752723 RepID=A0A1F7JTQ1_9BACT|nr:MAG: cell division protein FtsA [Candidatus Roizmanbacteria bacterium RIFCSPHIGHO2_02_FULL_43_11]OGK51544.1 MAG: cell division protein FtsA [Candidatus Roizmanbacteria bacterium RIFCSPLOWO2_01_FULL_42_14]OGK58989.1 MAG: cell division protein FtsA [Candidatus Roizmanbacteria bacterium RIFCSPLOWO2_02_FULL_43_10]
MAQNLLCGIDVGSSKMSCIIARVSEEEPTPRVMGFSSVPSRGVKRGQIVDINQVSSSLEQAIEQAERMAGAKVTSAFASVGGPHIESINSQGVVAVSHPDVEISDDDVSRVIDAAKAISLSSTREVIEVSPREYIVDGQGGIKNPLGMSGVRLEVNTHIITASMTNLKNLERCMSDLGIEIRGYVFSGLSSALATMSETEKELGAVLVDLGGGKIDIAVYIEGALTHSSSIPIGARHITNDIAVGLRVSLDSAEHIKLMLSDSAKLKYLKDKKDDVDISGLRLKEGLNSFSYKTVVDGIIRPRLEEMFEQVLVALDTNECMNLVPSGLIITGGGALSVGALEIAKRVIGLPARIGAPQHITGLTDEVMYPQYACVAGLLLYAKDTDASEKQLNVKDFDRILRNISMKGSVKKVRDLFKNFVP